MSPFLHSLPLTLLLILNQLMLVAASCSLNFTSHFWQKSFSRSFFSFSFLTLDFYSAPLQEDNKEGELRNWREGGAIKPLSWESILSVTPSLPIDMSIGAD